MARITEKLAIIACAMVPLAGVFFLGWSAATAIVLMWLDAYLFSFRVVPVMMCLSRADVQTDRNTATPVDWVAAFSISLFCWIFLTVPVSIASKPLGQLVAFLKPGGFEAEVYDLVFDAPWAFALLVAARMHQAFNDRKAARAVGKRGFVVLLKALAAVVACKGGLLFLLGSVAMMLVYDFPRIPGIFLVLAVSALAAVELYALRWFEPLRATGTPTEPPLVEAIRDLDGREVESKSAAAAGK
jgi:hypothetical protein